MKLLLKALFTLGAFCFNSCNARTVTDLSNGAVLAVDVSLPTANQTFEFPSFLKESGIDRMSIPIRGTTSVGRGEPDVSYIFIIDSSGSTLDYNGTCGTVLECEQDFFRVLLNAMAIL